jgi:type I restriction enzyme S subunit
VVPLGKVLSHNKEYITTLEPREYPKLSVKLYGKGVVLDASTNGAAVKMERHQLAKPGQVILSEIWGKKGAIGFVPPEGDGALCTSHFFLFDVNHGVIDDGWLRAIFRANYIAEQLGAQAFGTTGYAAVRPKNLLQATIPLPPLPEQQRIVAKIECLAAKVNEARGLRQLSLFAADATYQSAMHSIWSSADAWACDVVGNLVKTVSGQIDPRIEPFASMPHINGESMESNTGRLLSNYRRAKDDGVASGKYHFREGAVLYSKIRPYLRKTVVVPFEGICSADVYAINEIDERLDARFLKYSLLAPAFTNYANTLSGRTRMPKLNQKQLFAFNLPFPTKREQHRIVAYLDSLQAKVDELKRLQTESAAELDALLPAILDRAFKGDL